MIPFNRPSFADNDFRYAHEALSRGTASGNGPFAREVESELSSMHDGAAAMLTPSCTHALELAARLLNLQPGDEVVVPSFAFSSTASAFMGTGAKVVFADIRADTLNIAPESVEERLSPRTRAVCIVHYSGVGADPDYFASLCQSRGIALVEDNAHGLGASYQGQVLGTFGSMSALSFHDTKNLSCGEGGALIVNDPSLVDRAEILREKGTNRSRFLRGEIDKYTWVDIGSSWVLSDLLAGVLKGQLERRQEIHARRHELWLRYSRGLDTWAKQNDVTLPVIAYGVAHSAHIFHIRMPSSRATDGLIRHMRRHGVQVVTHYQALHASPLGRSLLAEAGDCPNSLHASLTVLRLPMFYSLSDEEQDRVIDAVRKFHVEP